MEEQYKFVINTCFKHKYQLIFLSDIDVDIFLNECKFSRDADHTDFIPSNSQ